MGNMEGRIHPTADVDRKAEIGAEAEIGPFCRVGAGVRIGRATRLRSHVIVSGPTEIGENCDVSPFCTIGMDPQDLKYKGDPTALRIGRDNILREYVNISRGTVGGGGLTTIGDHNYIMAYTHIAHDCIVGDWTLFANAATLAGHVSVGNFATIGAFSGVHQFCRIGAHAFVGGYSVITMDALPFMMTVGNRPRAYGINVIGLRRRNFGPERIDTLRTATRVLFQSRLNTSDALAKLRETFPAPPPDIAILIDFIETSKRGVIKR